MKKTALVLILPLFALVATAQQILVPEIPGTARPWSSLELNNDEDKFHFVVVTDRTGGHRPGIFEYGVSRINLVQPEFVVSVGDLIEGYTTDETELNSQWAEFNGFIDQLEMPFFYVAGNHDYTNEIMARQWKERFGADYYHFVYKDVLFLCLNSEDGATALSNPDFSEAQLAYVERTLRANPDVRWTMVFMHQPLWLSESAKNWLKVEALLEGRPHSVFTGHLHQYALHERNRSDYFVLATMGGASELRGKKRGEFDHFLWVTMTDKGPYFANILLDGVEDKSVQTYESLQLTESFNANPPVRFQPVFLEGEVPGEMTLLVTLTNTQPRPHRCEVVFEANETMIPEIDRIDRTVAPGAREEVRIRVKVVDPVAVVPLKALAKVEGERYAWDAAVHFQPHPKYRVEPAVQPVQVDGDLKEWGKLRFEKTAPGASAGDASFRFDVRTDDRFLYVGIDVEDDEIECGFGHSPLSQDGAFFVFDARPVPLSAYNLRHKDGIFRGEWLFLAASPLADSFELGYKELLPPGVMGKGQKTEKGYSVEYAVPVALLDRFHGGSWQNLRLNVSIMDKDSGSKEILQLSWMPDWIENIPGSGTFFRNEMNGK